MYPRTGGTILIADQDLESRHYLETALLSYGFAVQVAENSEEVLQSLRYTDHMPLSVVVLDLMVPGRGGLETLRALRRADQHLPVILMANPWSPSWPSEVEDDPAILCLEKPLFHQDLLQAINRLFRSTAAVAPAGSLSPSKILPEAVNPRMRHIEQVLQQVARADVPILFLGETGVGKEVLARRAHSRSRRAAGPFVKVNCAALPSELVESELFGYERGAFTGANRDQPGLFETAEAGTLLLDEIGDMDVRLQAKLLQVLQDGEFHRLGSSAVVRVDVRIMAATHCDLEAAVESGRFREDLFYRLNVVSIRIPPIRQRKDEILLLADHFLAKYSEERRPPVISAELRHALLEYDWPGNVRELENWMRRYLVLGDTAALARELRAMSLRVAPAQPPVPPPQRSNGSVFEQVREATRQAEVAAIRSALQTCKWNRKRAAELLNLDYKALLYKMRKFGIDGDRCRRRRAGALATA